MMKGLPWNAGISSVIMSLMACSVDIFPCPTFCSFWCVCVEIFLDYEIRLETGIVMEIIILLSLKEKEGEWKDRKSQYLSAYWV